MLEGDFFSTFLSTVVLSVQKGWKAIAKERAFFWSVQHIVTWYTCDHTATATKVSRLLNFL